MKRILTIQDMTCFGKCSITIVLPVLSAMGVECVPLPTAVFSTHTLFPDYQKTDLSSSMLSFARQWKDRNITFDTIYTGYLGSAKEIDLALEVIDMLKTEDTLLFCDPAMGDHGKLYRGIEEECVSRCRDLCGRADIIVPNITEACMLTGAKYTECPKEEELKSLCGKLCGLGAGTAVITGVSLSEGMTGVYGMNGLEAGTFCYQNDRVSASYHGTGDLFAGTAVGAIANGLSVYDAFRIASDYTAQTIRRTAEKGENPWCGVCFEETLPMLGEMIRFADPVADHFSGS